MQFVTDFADEAVMLPLFILVAVALVVSGWYRGTAAWLLAVGGVLAVMALLKFLFFSCIALRATGIHSPSGHTAAAAAIYGGGLVLLLRGRLHPLLLAAIPLLIAIVFAITRIALHAHVPAETLVGGAVGLSGAALCVMLAGRRPALRTWPMVASCLLVMVLLHGVRLHAETLIHHFILFTWLPLPTVCRV